MPIGGISLLPYNRYAHARTRACMRKPIQEREIEREIAWERECDSLKKDSNPPQYKRERNLGEGKSKPIMNGLGLGLVWGCCFWEREVLRLNRGIERYVRESNDPKKLQANTR